MCGLAGIISFISKSTEKARVDLDGLRNLVNRIEKNNVNGCDLKPDALHDRYAEGKSSLKRLGDAIRSLKRKDAFYEIWTDASIQDELLQLNKRLSDVVQRENQLFSDRMGHLDDRSVETISQYIEELKDITWCLSVEISDNIGKIKSLAANNELSPSAVYLFKKINAVLNSIDRLEVRGRDSAGISLLFVVAGDQYCRFKDQLHQKNLIDAFNERTGKTVLPNRSISVSELPGSSDDPKVSMIFTYKIAAEIGSLGDNVAFIREEIARDTLFQIAARLEHQYQTIFSHTRWASVGAINEYNCHPVDNKLKGPIGISSNGTIHVSLNGDIDNFIQLREEHEQSGEFIPADITTDTKIIPVRIQKYVKEGIPIDEAFRRAVSDFKGSHAISMVTDLAPEKLFLAQKGSGQAIFIGLAPDHYMSASEVYGFVEETSDYLKLDGEKMVEGNHGLTQGQIFILDQTSPGGLQGITAMYYDGTPVELRDESIKHTYITSRDIDRQGYSHYFLKEISEAPRSVERTLQNRWKIAQSAECGVQDFKPSRMTTTLNQKEFPNALKDALISGQIRRVFFMGQGTAGIAAQTCAEILTYYMNDPGMMIASFKASELSGFRLGDDDGSMTDALVVAISQSGTTTDTNRTVDMVKTKGAKTIGIVNRRDSDLTFKVDGVIYTSSGRDIEMSVASTKAFYAQIVAGATLGLHMARLKGRRDEEFISDEIRQLLQLPNDMRQVLSMHPQIGESARKTALTRTFWAVVGSGPNKSSADEIRIKLSELCYKTISTDYVEDKKHIDLSSEPLIIVCAAGTRRTVIGDIIKDTAIFRAHKAVPIVIADEGDVRFEPYAEAIFYVPPVNEHLAPILNTLAGHIWGYYAALAINDGSRFLYHFRQDVQAIIDEYAKNGMDVYELVLEKSFREKIAAFYSEFRKKQNENRLMTSLFSNTASNLTLLLKYLSGKLPVSDFEIDFGIKGTAMNMLNKLFECLGDGINAMARPVDAIKHQAKTVTVGTSRISDKTEGLLFESLEKHKFNVAQLINRNVLVLKNIQKVISKILGYTLYKIEDLNLLGEPTDMSTIRVLKQKGTSQNIESRVNDMDNRLAGTKRIIVRNGNVYIGKGRRDDRSIVVIPIISASPSTPNQIEYLLLLHIAFKENVPLSDRIKALGGKYEHIKHIVQENIQNWDDPYLDLVSIEKLFGFSAEKIGEFIVSCLSEERDS